MKNIGKASKRFNNVFMKRNSNLNAPILLVIKVAENKICDVLCFIQNLLVSGWLLDPDQRYDKEESMFHLHSLVSTMSSLSGHNHLAEYC